MRLSTRLTIAMVALVLLTASAIGVLNYRNATAAALPRALDRIETHVQLIVAELDASVRGARVDVTTQGRAVDGSSVPTCLAAVCSTIRPSRNGARGWPHALLRN